MQTYETLTKDNSGRFTTSFLRACDTAKDNRLLPKGWTMEGPGEGLSGVYLKATHPGPAALQDADFVAGTGSDTTTYRVQLSPGADPERIRVRATLHYQALPPYYLKNLFATAPDGQATQRLHALASLLDLEGTPIENWKLEIASDSAVPSAVD